MFLQRIHAQFPMFTWWLTIICNSSLRDPMPFSDLCGHQAHILCTCRQTTHRRATSSTHAAYGEAVSCGSALLPSKPPPTVPSSCTTPQRPLLVCEAGLCGRERLLEQAHSNCLGLSLLSLSLFWSHPTLNATREDHVHKDSKPSEDTCYVPKAL